MRTDVGVAAWHAVVPALVRQSWPAPHAVPHAPQLLRSEVRSAHESDGPGSQSIWLAGHAHVPVSQRADGPQTVPHAPQLVGSLLVSVQLAPHAICPGGQERVHMADRPEASS